MIDSYRHKGLRKKLVLTLKEKGIRDERVLAAINKIPRHLFLNSAFEDHAYEDKAFPIGENQTISQPYTVAFQTSLLNVQKREKVLEIGTGSGYQAAVIAVLKGRLYTIERHKILHQRAKSLLEKIGLGLVRFYWKDGYKGLPEFAPFDKILVTAGAPTIPKKLTIQLKIGGVMVVPVGEGVQRMLRITRLSETQYKKEDFGTCKFVPFVEGIK